jgi:hypothetical protein
LTVDLNSTDGFVPGAILTAHLSDPDGTQTPTHQWSVLTGGQWQAIAGATQSAYTVASSDVGKQIEVTTHYVDSFGNESLTSAPHSVSAPPSTDPAPPFFGRQSSIRRST